MLSIVQERIASFLTSRSKIERDYVATMQAFIESYKKSAEYSTKLKRRVDEKFYNSKPCCWSFIFSQYGVVEDETGRRLIISKLPVSLLRRIALFAFGDNIGGFEEAFTLCHNLANEMASNKCEDDINKILACTHFQSFSTTCNIPRKVRKDGKKLRKYIDGQCKRFSRATIKRKIERQIEMEKEKEYKEIHLLDAQISKLTNNYIDEHCEDLSLSDHLPIRCTISFDGEDSDRAVKRTLVISSWNIQEFVKDGISTYIGHMPSIVGTKGLGKSKWLRDAMLQPKVIDHHCQRVVRVVQRELSAEHSIAICLQEVDVKILKELRRKFGYDHVLNSNYKDEEVARNQKNGKCSSITCIVLSPTLMNSTSNYQYAGQLEDIVVETFIGKKNQQSKTRKYTRIAFKCNITGNKYELVSIHVRHDSLDSSYNSKSNNTSSKGKEKENQKGSNVNMDNLIHTEKQLMKNILPSTTCIFAIGDWNAPLKKKYVNSPKHKHHGMKVVHCLTPNDETQYMNVNPVDGLVIIGKDDDNKKDDRISENNVTCNIQLQ